MKHFILTLVLIIVCLAFLGLGVFSWAKSNQYYKLIFMAPSEIKKVTTSKVSLNGQRVLNCSWKGHSASCLVAMSKKIKKGLPLLVTLESGAFVFDRSVSKRVKIVPTAGGEEDESLDEGKPCCSDVFPFSISRSLVNGIGWGVR